MIYELNSCGDVSPIKNIDLPVSCALGCFDGVHLGHRALISETQNDKKSGYVSAIWTFSEPIGGEHIENVISRLSICGSLGVKYAICEDFNSVRELTPKQFILRLFNDFGVRKFVCGRDFRFGFNREGSADTLKTVAAELGAEVTVIEPVMLPKGNEKVSSTYIRSLISDGKVEEANALLMRPFSVTAKITEGKHIGRTMDFPTVNQMLERGRVIPRFGVYCSASVIDGIRYPSVTNIGFRPTVNNDLLDVTCETHIIGKSFDLYEKNVTVELYRYLRPEKHFPSLDSLRQAIKEDCKSAEEFFLLSFKKS